MSLRDLLLFALVFGSIPFILRRPYIGVLMYLWVSVMNPHRLTYGFAYDFEFAFVVAVVTILSTLLSKDTTRPPVNSLVVALAMFIGWTGVSTFFALYFDDSFGRWVTLMKTQLFVLLILMLIHTKEQIRQLIWVLVLSIGYYGAKGGAWILLTGGADKVWGPEGSYIHDNNALAVAVIIMIPIMRYLQLTTPHRVVRWGLTATMLLCGVGALGTHSRGALLAAAGMLTVMWWKSQKKMGLTIVALAAIPLTLSFMPENWYKRMDTIATYEQDSSANMRLNAWETMYNLAKDRPLVGGGFELATETVYQKYSPDPSFPPQVAHSIYFQALGEHGFVGLGLYLLLLFMFWRHSSALVQLSSGRSHLAWAGEFGRMMQVGLAGFATGGAFLSLINYDVPYYLMAATVVTSALIKQELKNATASTPVPAVQYPRWRTGSAERSANTRNE